MHMRACVCVWACARARASIKCTKISKSHFIHRNFCTCFNFCFVAITHSSWPSNAYSFTLQVHFNYSLLHVDGVPSAVHRPNRISWLLFLFFLFAHFVYTDKVHHVHYLMATIRPRPIHQSLAPLWPPFSIVHRRRRRRRRSRWKRNIIECAESVIVVARLLNGNGSFNWPNATARLMKISLRGVPDVHWTKWANWRYEHRRVEV